MYLNGNKDEMYILARGTSAFTKDSASMGEFIKDCGYIRINKFRMPYKKVSILDGFLSKYLGDVTITIPEVIMTKLNSNTFSQILGGVWSDNGFIYFLLHPTSSIEVNETFYILKVDVTDFSTEVITMKNTYTSAISLGAIADSYSYGFYMSVPCCGNNEYFLFRDNKNKKFVRISLTDNTDIAVLKKNGEDFIFSSVAAIEYDGFNFIVVYDSSGYPPTLMLNLKEQGNEVYYSGLPYAYYIGAQLSDTSSQSRLHPVYEEINGKKQIRSAFFVRTNNSFTSGLLSPNYENTSKENALNSDGNEGAYFVQVGHYNNLFTINNLGASVLKTASQSMKVTYTLTEVEGA